MAREVPPQVQRFLATPQPGRRASVADLRLLAVDMETTGLDPRTAVTLSLGWVPVDRSAVVLGEADEVLLRPDPADLGAAGVGQSATLHGLTDDRLGRGVDPALGWARLVEALTGRVLLAHHAALEVALLESAARRLWGVRLRVRSVDTMALQARIVAPGFADEPGPEQLRLWTARARFGLPAVQAHDALHDALSCAELYLAQVAELGLGDGRLRDLSHR